MSAIAEAWKRRDIILLVVLLLALIALGKKDAEYRELLASKAKVEVREVVKTKIVRVSGPERVTTRTIFRPGGVKVITRVRESDGSTTTTGKESDIARSESPTCPQAQAKRWYLGGGVNAMDREDWSARGGITLFDRFDVGYRFQRDRLTHHVEAAVRF